jgi:hypothetical protein
VGLEVAQRPTSLPHSQAPPLLSTSDNSLASSTHQQRHRHSTLFAHEIALKSHSLQFLLVILLLSNSFVLFLTFFFLFNEHSSIAHECSYEKAIASAILVDRVGGSHEFNVMLHLLLVAFLLLGIVVFLLVMLLTIVKPYALYILAHHAQCCQILFFTFLLIIFFLTFLLVMFAIVKSYSYILSHDVLFMMLVLDLIIIILTFLLNA